MRSGSLGAKVRRSPLRGVWEPSGPRRLLATKTLQALDATAKRLFPHAARGSIRLRRALIEPNICQKGSKPWKRDV
jgi:hypothetical protein